MQPRLRDKQEMTVEHRNVRTQLNITQTQRWNLEEQKRIARIRKGFKGFQYKLNGRYWKNRKTNEHEMYQANGEYYGTDKTASSSPWP